jgi:hypothetical protein
MEEYERSILLAHRHELDRFPASVGTDDGAGGADDLGWETIEHPAAEVLGAFGDGDGGGGGKRGRRKRPAVITARELARALSGGKRPPGGGEEEEDTKGEEEGERGDGGGGFMRVPRFWDPAPYGIIADERERRSGGGDGVGGGDGEHVAPPNDAPPPPRDGVRRYLGGYGSRLMTPAEAGSVGSRVPVGRGGGERLDTIFVAIASYRDYQCSRTVESIFARAARPERVRVAVVDQVRVGIDGQCSVPPGGTCDSNPDQAACVYKDRIDYLTVDASLSVGPVFARHLGHRMYRGEYFAMQTDAHVEFVKGWDDEIVDQWRSAKNEMAILTAYVSGTEDHINVETGERTSKSRPIMCMSDFEGGGEGRHLRHGQQPEGDPHIHDMPTIEPFWAAGFSFGRGHFVVNVPYDQHLPWIFQGEEISIGLRGFS